MPVGASIVAKIQDACEAPSNEGNKELRKAGGEVFFTTPIILFFFGIKCTWSIMSYT